MKKILFGTLAATMALTFTAIDSASAAGTYWTTVDADGDGGLDYITQDANYVYVTGPRARTYYVGPWQQRGAQHLDEHAGEELFWWYNGTMRVVTHRTWEVTDYPVGAWQTRGVYDLNGVGGDDWYYSFADGTYKVLTHNNRKLIHHYVGPWTYRAFHEVSEHAGSEILFWNVNAGTVKVLDTVLNQVRPYNVGTGLLGWNIYQQDGTYGQEIVFTKSGGGILVVNDSLRTMYSY